MRSSLGSITAEICGGPTYAVTGTGAGDIVRGPEHPKNNAAVATQRRFTREIVTRRPAHSQDRGTYTDGLSAVGLSDVVVTTPPISWR